MVCIRDNCELKFMLSLTQTVLFPEKELGDIIILVNDRNLFTINLHMSFTGALRACFENSLIQL